MTHSDVAAVPRGTTASVWILSILLGLALVAGSVSLVLKQTFLNPAFHRQIIEDQWVVNQLSADLPALFLNIERSSSSSSPLQQIPENSLSQLVWKVIPEDWVAGQVESLVQRAVDFVESDQESFAIVIDLSTIKTNMEAKTAELANSVIAGLPACTGKDLLGYLDYALTGDNSHMPYCLPPEPFAKLVRTAVANSFTFMTARMPQNIEVVRFSLEDTALQPLAKWLRALRIMLQVYRVAPFVVLGLLLALLLTNLKGLRVAFHGMGWALLAAGVGMLLVALAIFLWGRSLDVQALGQGGMIPLNSNLVEGYVSAVFRGIETMMLQLAAVLGIGGALIVLLTGQKRFAHSMGGSIAPV